MILRLTILWLTILCAMLLPSQQAFSGTLEVMIPLYKYPTWYNASLPNDDPDSYIWDDIAAANIRVPITAVINPSNGPGGGPPNADYLVGLHHLREAGVKIFGYVRTNFANRDGLAPLSQVYTDIRLYHDFFDVDGIFLDEAASGHPTPGVDENAIANYYKAVYDSIHSLTPSDLMTVVINPGTQTNEEYFSTPATDASVIFENSQGWEAYAPDPYVNHLPRKNFSMLLYDVNEIKDMKQAINLAVKRNIGYVYVTDDGHCETTDLSSCSNPWDSLPTYWEEELVYIEQLNSTCRFSHRHRHKQKRHLRAHGSQEWPDSHRRNTPHIKCFVPDEPGDVHPPRKEKYCDRGSRHLGCRAGDQQTLPHWRRGH